MVWRAESGIEIGFPFAIQYMCYVIKAIKEDWIGNRNRGFPPFAIQVPPYPIILRFFFRLLLRDWSPDYYQLEIILGQKKVAAKLRMTNYTSSTVIMTVCII